MSETDEIGIAVPQMVNLDSLTKIIVAFSKAGGSQREVSTREVAQISGIDPNNVGLNNKFFVSMGMVEGRRGSYKLTPAGSAYAKALDWGRLEEAQSILKQTIKDKPLVQKITSYVDLNKPVSKDALIAKIAGFANVPNEPRYLTGIKAFVEMLTLSRVLEETKEGLLESGERDESEKTKSDITISSDKKSEISFIETKSSFSDWQDFLKRSKEQLAGSIPTKEQPFTLALTINIDNNTDPNKLKEIIKALKESISSST